MAVERPRSGRGRKLPPEPLTADEVRGLLRACSRRAHTGLRNRALIVVLWRAGLRVGEALDLRSKDLDREAGTLRVLHGKGDKARVVGLDPEAFSIVERWLDRRAELGISRTAPVFCTLKGGPLDPSYLRQLMPRLRRRAGIQKRVHCHGLRHSHACDLAAEGVPVNMIRAQLGHKNIGTTSRYLDHISPREVIERIRGRPSWDDGDVP